jgi:bacterioferritin-associated ferredoxin
MYICHCRAVTDGKIRAAIAAGARDPAEVARHCGAGARCGGCLPALQALLAESVVTAAASPLTPAGHAA